MLPARDNNNKAVIVSDVTCLRTLEWKSNVNPAQAGHDEPASAREAEEVFVDKLPLQKLSRISQPEITLIQAMMDKNFSNTCNEGVHVNQIHRYSSRCDEDFPKIQYTALKKNGIKCYNPFFCYILTYNTFYK